MMLRPAATAIAAVLALSSTSLMAQETVTADTGTAPAAAPATATETPPATTETVTTTTTSTTESSSPTPTKTTNNVRKTTAKPAAHAAVKASAPVAMAKPAPAPAPAAAPAAEAAATPLTPTPDTTATPPVVEAAPAPVAPADNSSADYAIGGALAALAVGGAALLAGRRRRSLGEVEAAPVETIETDRVIRHEPAVVPAAAGRSAFAWGHQPAVAAPAAATSLSPTELALRGPTPDNPSLSLKKRLKRAAFFESHERAVAAGEAKPISRLAGLPQRAVEAMKASSASFAPRPAFQPA